MSDTKVHYDYGSVIASLRMLHQEADQDFPTTFSQLLDSNAWFDYIPRTSDCFDVSKYFQVFRHISPPPGNELDYGYWCFDGDGGPSLFLRDASLPNVIPSPEELLADPPKWGARPGSFPETELEQDAADEMEARAMAEQEMRQNPLASRLQTDGTAEGFFELVLFNAMAGQFYLAWHAAYNDIKILTDRREVQRILDRIAPTCSKDTPSKQTTSCESRAEAISDKLFEILGQVASMSNHSEEQNTETTGTEAAHFLSEEEFERQRNLGIDPTPRIRFLSEELVEVSVLMFSDWKGLFSVSEQIARTYPLRFLNTKIKVLVKYESDLTF
jgi:hypothetical protein